MSNNPQTRTMRFRQVERCLDSGMQIRQWCKLNKVPESTFYGWLKIYREQSGGKEKANRDWIELSRQEIKNTHALAVKTNGTLDIKDTCAHERDIAYPPIHPCR